jgi:2-oxoglutarate ferredoxin oxidoreductase subunit beta
MIDAPGLALVPKTTEPRTAKDFDSGEQVRWCPGCDDYAILAAFRAFLPELGVARENVVVLSGIGCAARFPYYLNTYGMHAIHGRSPAIATGLALSRPDLSIWVVTGDGDALSIGGNHLIHALRRNVNINILMFDNRIYGLTKGQYSPTSAVGTVTKSTPAGSLDQPFDALSLALGAGAGFVARTPATDRRHLTSVLRAAAAHPGTAFVEVLQNCPIFNDGAWDAASGGRPPLVRLEHGEPILFGEPRRGLRLTPAGLTPVELPAEAENADSLPADLLRHDAAHPDPGIAFLLAGLGRQPGAGLPIGVLRAVARPTYEQAVGSRVAGSRGDGERAGGAGADGGLAAVASLLRAGDTWTVPSPDGSTPS